jgi:signal transduction histidine kinase
VLLLQDMTREHEVDRMKTEFISTTAHELRTPLTSIQGFSEILETRPDLDEEQRQRFLHHINTQSKALSSIISDLLDLSRIEARQESGIYSGIDAGIESGIESGTSSSAEPVDMRMLVEEAVADFHPDHESHDFGVETSDKPSLVMGDSAKLTQAVKNLVSNAVKYSPDGGSILVRCVVSESQCRVTVEDHGIGMTPDQVERVFEKFYRANPSASIVGTGLGMSIVKSIVEAHRGTVMIESAVGLGTKVDLRFPLLNGRRGAAWDDTPTAEQGARHGHS